MAQDLTDRVIQFLSEQLGVREQRIAANTTIFTDLRVDGDDGVELLEAFGDRFDVDMTACEPARHFGPDGGSLERFRP